MRQPTAVPHALACRRREGWRGVCPRWERALPGVVHPAGPSAAGVPLRCLCHRLAAQQRTTVSSGCGQAGHHGTAAQICDEQPARSQAGLTQDCSWLEQQSLVGQPKQVTPGPGRAANPSWFWGAATAGCGFTCSSPSLAALHRGSFAAALVSACAAASSCDLLSRAASHLITSALPAKYLTTP